jgi:hypothetical protein
VKEWKKEKKRTLEQYEKGKWFEPFKGRKRYGWERKAWLLVHSYFNHKKLNVKGT